MTKAGVLKGANFGELDHLKAGFHKCDFGCTMARPVVCWACVAYFGGEDSPSSAIARPH